MQSDLSGLFREVTKEIKHKICINRSFSLDLKKSVIVCSLLLKFSFSTIDDIFGAKLPISLHPILWQNSRL